MKPYQYFGLGFKDITAMIECQVGKAMEHDMGTGLILHMVFHKDFVM